jgi:F0F1-type ATP synthase membrane subunit b/b'
MLKIPPDYTFLVQIVIFVALWIVLKRLWFDPALRIVRERASRSEGAIAEARAIKEEAEHLAARHAAALDEAKAEAQRQMQEALRKAEAEQKRLIDEAREETRHTLGEVRGRVAEEVAIARRGLRDSAEEVARIVAEKVLGRRV